MLEFQQLLQESSRSHGHLCPGQVLGVRMAMLGLSLIGLDDPRGRDRKSLLVFIEMDRCAADAIQSVTGCSLGRRTMKFLDYGKMAATFLNLKTGKAVRVSAREDARIRTTVLLPWMENKYAAQFEAYKSMDDRELFDVMHVSVAVPPEDMPGRPLARVRCEQCGEYVQDRRHVLREGQVFCRPCAEGGYYRAVSAAGSHSAEEDPSRHFSAYRDRVSGELRPAGEHIPSARQAARCRDGHGSACRTPPPAVPPIPADA